MNEPSDDRAKEPKGEDRVLKKPFVEPTVSVPQDVLEATRFFLQATPGVSGVSTT